MEVTEKMLADATRKDLKAARAALRKFRLLLIESYASQGETRNYCTKCAGEISIHPELAAVLDGDPLCEKCFPEGYEAYANFLRERGNAKT